MPPKAWGQNRANTWSSQTMPSINQVANNNNNNNKNNNTSSLAAAKSDYTAVKVALTQYIVSEINSNNCLGLTEDEVNGMASELVNSNTKAEVYNWCTTLMMGEPFAAELIKRRSETGPPFVGEELTSSMPLIPQQVETILSASPLEERELYQEQNGRVNKKGKQLNVKASRNTVSGGKDRSTRKPLQSSTTNITTPYSSINNYDVNYSNMGKAHRNKNTMASALKQSKSECGCFGTVHNVRINCANCGRIICELENDTECYYCGLEPFRCLAYEIAVEEGKVSEAAQAENEFEYKAAIAQRDKLLEYAMHRAKRTTVIDDQAASLFTAQNAWLSPEERKAAEKNAARAEQEARIKTLQQHRGAFTVQLELMGQTVPSAVSKGNPVQIKLSMAEDDKCKVSKTVSNTASQEEMEEQSSTELDSSKYKANANNVNVNSNSNIVDNNDEDDEDEIKIDETKIEARAAPLPSLLQSIWYSPDDDDNNSNHGNHELYNNVNRSANKDNNKRNTDHYFSFTETEPEGMKVEQPLSSASLDACRPVRRYDEVSRRVQQNYFEDDMNTYKEEKVAARHKDAIIGQVNGSIPKSDVSPSTANKNNVNDEPMEKVKNDINKGKKDVNIRKAEKDKMTVFAPMAQIRSVDEGVCLSMHQPWASLLVAGIKRHEGRVWKTEYRGRLWIHAAAAEPVAIKETEDHYAPFMRQGQNFPSHYPTRVLLGYVYLTACLSRSEYEATFAPEERQEESPFLFICTEPKFLPFPLPMSGNHKLFTLDHKVHMAAKKQLNEAALESREQQQQQQQKDCLNDMNN